MDIPFEHLRTLVAAIDAGTLDLVSRFEYAQDCAPDEGF